MLDGFQFSIADFHFRTSHSEMKNWCPLWLDFLFRKLQLQSQRIGEAVGQVCHADQQVQVDDFRLREVLFQFGDIGVGDLFGAFRELLRVLECGFFFVAETAVVAGFQGFPIFGSEDSLRRSEVVLGSIMAAVQERDTQVDRLI